MSEPTVWPVPSSSPASPPAGRCGTAAPSVWRPPPRPRSPAHLRVPWAVEERHGWVWIAPEPTADAAPPRPREEPVAERAPVPPAPDGAVFGNLDPSLEHAWHPVARSIELRRGGWLQVRLLG